MIFKAKEIQGLLSTLTIKVLFFKDFKALKRIDYFQVLSSTSRTCTNPSLMIQVHFYVFSLCIEWIMVSPFLFHISIFNSKLYITLVLDSHTTGPGFKTRLVRYFLLSFRLLTTMTASS